jgi:hypothetical protein
MRKVTTTATSADAADRPTSGLQTIRRVLPYLWPEGQFWVKRRVVLAIPRSLSPMRPGPAMSSAGDRAMPISTHIS